MKKILNKKLLVGFLFIIVFAVILISSSALKANARAGTISVTVTAGSATLSYPNSGTNIHWESSGADSCDTAAGTTSGDFGTGALSVGTHTFTVTCTKADPIAQCDTYTVDLVSNYTTGCTLNSTCGPGKVCLFDASFTDRQGVYHESSCAPCPGSCTTGYIASCAGDYTMCTEDAICSAF